MSAGFSTEPQNQAGIPQTEIVNQEPLNLCKTNQAKHSSLHNVRGHISGSFYLFALFFKRQYLYEQYSLYNNWPPEGALI